MGKKKTQTQVVKAAQVRKAKGNGIGSRIARILNKKTR
jgi:hypothetical protein